MVRLFKHYIPHAVLLLGLIDFALLLLAGDFAWRLRAWQVGMEPGLLLYRLPMLVAFAIVTQGALIAVGVFGTDALRSMRFAGARLLVGVSLAVLAFALIAFVLHGHTFWRSTLFFAMVLAIALLMANRLLAGGMLGAAAFRRRVMVLGAGARARRITALAERPESGFAVVGYIAMNAGQDTIEHAVPRNSIADLSRHVRDLGATEVVLALEERRNALPLKDLLRIKTAGVHVNDF
jgi:FlaA1/EpsC-like NDP-sugar epimerase